MSPPTAPVGARATSRFVLAVKPIGYTKDLILTPELLPASPILGGFAPRA